MPRTARAVGTRLPFMESLVVTMAGHWWKLFSTEGINLLVLGLHREAAVGAPPGLSPSIEACCPPGPQKVNKYHKMNRQKRED